MVTILKISQSESNAEAFNLKFASIISNIIVGDYFTSPETLLLFHPKTNETAIDFMVCSIRILGEGAINDDI